MKFQDRQAQVVCWFRITLFLVVVAGCSQGPDDLTADVAQIVDEAGVDVALAVLDRRLDLAPHNTAIRLLKAKLLVESRAVDEALQEYQELWQIQGDHHPELLRCILNAYLQEEVRAGGATRVRAAPLVASLADPALLPLLYELASKGDPAARTVAIDALGRLASPSALAFLTGLLRDPDTSVRAQAARRLGRSGVEMATVHLGTLLEDDRETVRMAAAEGLARA